MYMLMNISTTRKTYRHEQGDITMTVVTRIDSGDNVTYEMYGQIGTIYRTFQIEDADQVIERLLRTGYVEVK